MQPHTVTEREASAASLPPAVSQMGDHSAHDLTQASRLDGGCDLYAHLDYMAGDFQIPATLSSSFILRTLGDCSPRAQSNAGCGIVYECSKRAVDIIISSALLTLATPLFIVIMVAVKCTSRGPIFFKQSRLGRNGTEFGCLKFRTMVVDAEERLTRCANLRQQFEATFKIKNDPRVTPAGAFLRRTSLDELPQLWQVFRGEMTLVGPRPIVKRELAKYAIYGDKLLSVKPGLSGLWQVCGRSDTTYAQRVMMDMHYIDQRCILLDLKLLLCTAAAVIRKSGAC